MDSQSTENSRTFQGKTKEVLVAPLAARREALAVTLMIAAIIGLMMVRFSIVAPETAVDEIKPYQRLTYVLKNQAPALYRSLSSVIPNIIDLKEENGTWPDIATLKEEALPPFDLAFLPPALRGYTWTRYEGKSYVDYFGVNVDAGKESEKEKDPLENSFILRIIDLKTTPHPHPHSGSDKDSSARYSAQIWMFPSTRDYPGEALLESGWKWIITPNDPNRGKVGNVSEKPGE